MNGAATLSRRLRIGGLLIGIGLLVEALTLSWANPLSFMAFIFLGGSLIAVGVAFYLWAVVSSSAET